MQNLKSSNFEIMAISKNKKKQSLDPLSKAENVLRPFCCRKLVFGAGRSLHHPTFFLSPSISDCDNRILEISMPGIRHVYALRYWIISTTDLFTRFLLTTSNFTSLSCPIVHIPTFQFVLSHLQNGLALPCLLGLLLWLHLSS